MSYTVLKQELTTDPDGLGYSTHIANGNDEALANLLNQPFQSVLGLAKISTIVSYLDQNFNADGMPLSYVIAKLSKKEVEDQIKAICSIIIKLNQVKYETIEMNLPVVQGMIDILVAASVITTQQKNEILALGTTMKSKAELILGKSASSSDVAIALRST